MSKKSIKNEAEPRVGIFWLYKGTVVTDSSPLSKAEPYGDSLGHPPLQPQSGQRFLYFASEDSREIVATGGATVALAGKTEATRYGASTLSLKGRMFELLASGLVRNPARWTVLLEDDTPSTAIELMESGLESD